MITKEQVDQLGTWARWVDCDGLVRIFGEDLGQHIWDKWHDTRFKGDFLAYWGFMDSETQQKIIDAINRGA